MADKKLNEEKVINPEEVTEVAAEEVVVEEVKAEIVPDVIDELATINETTTITGDITTKGHIAIAGTVNGNVSAKGNIVITGMVKGDIKCDNLILDNCSLNTNIEAKGEIQIKEGSVIKGNIKCSDITVDGEVTGDIEVLGALSIASNASVKGNVKAKSIGMKFGGKLTGNITMHGEN